MTVFEGVPPGFYEAVGGAETFRRLVHRFYEGIATDPVLRPMYPAGDLSGPEERLRKVGERVGLPPHVHSESFFILAPRMSTLFSRLERGDYSTPAAVKVLYANPPGPPNMIRQDMLDIINQWSIATGRDMKARRTTITPRTATVAVGAGSRNGATVR